MNTGMFWTQEALDREEVPYDPETDLTTYKWGKKLLYGMPRSTKHGQPDGVVRMFELQQTRVDHGTEEDHSSRAIVKGQLKASYDAMSSNILGTSVSMEKNINSARTSIINRSMFNNINDDDHTNKNDKNTSEQNS